MTLKQLTEEMLTGWIAGKYKIIKAPFDKKDKDLLEGCGMVRFIADSTNKKFYAFDSEVLHEEACDRLGLHYSFPPDGPVFFGIARWNRSTGKLKYHSNTSMGFANKEDIKKVVEHDFKFATPYIDGLNEYMEELRNRL